MIFDFLPGKIKNGLSKINTDKLYEIRIRQDYSVLLNYDNQKKFLSLDGVTDNAENSIKVYNEDIKSIINTLTENSIYAFNDRIKRGYLTFEGVRIGIAGECVMQNGEIITIKNITSLNIRIPHEILGCADKTYKEIFSGQVVYNSLIVSPPSFGKTTILKDLARKIALEKKLNILIIDERGEFFSVEGNYIDKIKNSNKLYAFDYGLRSMSPEIIITDELSSFDDWACAERAVVSGVKIIASCHGASVKDVWKKEYYKKGIFDKYIVLNGFGRAGVIKEVYAEKE